MIYIILIYVPSNKDVKMKLELEASELCCKRYPNLTCYNSRHSYYTVSTSTSALTANHKSYNFG